MLCKTIKLYENREDVTLTTYVIDDSREMLNGDSRPAILICPGGAYLGLSDREGEPVALRFAAMGYHAFVLRYSVYFEGKPGVLKPGEKHEEAKQHCIHPSPMRDIAKAFIVIGENAEAWKVDADKIALCGFSAGAHNCAMYSVYWNKAVIYDYFKMEAEIFRPAAAILGYALADYFAMSKREPNNDFAKNLSNLANLALMGTVSPDDEVMRELSPSRNVTTDTPPMFLWATAADELVPVTNTLAMAAALAEKNIPFETHIFEEGVHGLSLADQTSAGVDFQIDDNAAKWVSLAECWLKKRFALRLEEKG